MLTKKHYESVAAIIKSEAGCLLCDGGQSSDYHLHQPASATVTLANKLADYFATDNARFDRDRFLRACGVEG